VLLQQPEVLPYHGIPRIVKPGAGKRIPESLQVIVQEKEFAIDQPEHFII
jgi:hypothetical protein